MLTEKQANDILYDEFMNSPYCIKDPFGHTTTKRKIIYLILACINEGLSEYECNDSMNSIIMSFPFEAHDITKIREIIKEYYAVKK